MERQLTPEQYRDRTVLRRELRLERQRQARRGRLLIINLMRRDGSRCVWCGIELHPRDYRTTIEHLVPRRHDGPRSDMANMVLACQGCNHERADRDLDDFYRRCRRSGRDVQVQTLLAALARCACLRAEDCQEYAFAQLVKLRDLIQAERP